MSQKLDSIANLAFGLAAIGIAVAFVWRSFTGTESTSSATASFLPDWQAAAEQGVEVTGDSSAPVTMLVFSDFQCPACRGFHLGTVRRLSQSVRTVYLHYPLAYHAQAEQAARATECMRHAPRINDWVDSLFAHQDSLDVFRLRRLALAVGNVDSASFTHCLLNPATAARVKRDSDRGDAINLSGTPTVLINGKVLPKPPSPSTLDSIVRSIRSANSVVRR